MQGLRLLLLLWLCVSASAWKCFKGCNVAGWDRFHTRPLPKRFKVVETLEDCKYTCSGPSECTFVVFNRATGQCWEKYSWDDGPDGFTGPAKDNLVCTWGSWDTEKKWPGVCTELVD